MRAAGHPPQRALAQPCEVCQAHSGVHVEYDVVQPHRHRPVLYSVTKDTREARRTASQSHGEEAMAVQGRLAPCEQSSGAKHDSDAE